MDPPVHVLGIALVVEEIGKEAKFVFRYPSPAISSQESGDENPPVNDKNNTTIPAGMNSGTGTNTAISSKHDQDIFFKFPSRVMAKLFRSKTPGEPITLKIGGVIFCFQSLLLNPANVASQNFSDGRSTTAANTTTTTSANSISVILAIFPEENPLEIPRAPRPVSSQQRIGIDSSSQLSMEAMATSDSDTSHHLQLTPKKSPNHRQSSDQGNQKKDASDRMRNDQTQMSIAFLAVRRAHVSLGRLCKVLQREERRCLYVSRNIKMEETASSPTSPTLTGIPLHGNLARELAQSYHALSRNGDMNVKPSPSSLLSNREGIVYINNHIAVHLEAVSLRKFGRVVEEERASTNGTIDPISTLRSNHTLLFTNVTAAKLAKCINSGDGDESMMKCISSHQHRLKKLLQVVDPFKSMKEMAHDILLPLQIVFEMANALINSGACVAVPVIEEESTKFICSTGSTQKLASLSLAFAQQFGPEISPFLVVAALTSPMDTGFISGQSYGKAQPTLSDVVLYCTLLMDQHTGFSQCQHEEEDGLRFRMLVDRLSLTLTSPRTYPGFHAIQYDEYLKDALKPALVAMVVWLRAHSIIVELKEYPTLIRTTSNRSEL